MHVQVRATPAASERNVEAFLKVISEPEGLTGDGQPREPINIEGVTGTDLENDADGRHIVFSFDHDREADVATWLAEARYEDVTFLNAENGDMFWAELGGNAPGHLLDKIRDAKAAFPNRDIKDILIGQETKSPNRVYVQITFEAGQSVAPGNAEG